MSITARRVLFVLGCIALSAVGISARWHGASWWQIFPLIPGACVCAIVLRVIPIYPVEKSQSEQVDNQNEAK